MFLTQEYLSGAARYRAEGNTREARRSFAQYRNQLDALQVHDRLELGAYEVCSNLGPGIRVRMPLTWEILRREGSRVLLLSEFCVDCNLMGAPGKPGCTDWSRSFVREELNGRFFEKSFAPFEKALILTTHVETAPGGDDAGGAITVTEDRLFLLSVEEVLRYFDGDRAADFYVREHWVPVNADTAGARTDLVLLNAAYGEEALELDREAWWWWLRTPGSDPDAVAYVDFEGRIITAGFVVDADETGVRPAMWIDLDRFDPEN